MLNPYVQAPALGQGRPNKKHKVALLLAYCGAGYYGIQFQKYDEHIQKSEESQTCLIIIKPWIFKLKHA